MGRDKTLNDICSKYTFNTYDDVLNAAKEYIRILLDIEISDRAELRYAERTFPLEDVLEAKGMTVRKTKYLR
jgi:hypothetical protein